MTEANSTHYLARDDYENIHAALSAWAKREDEPIPPFSLVNENDIDALVHMPKHAFFGVPAYPTLAEKAAIIFYTINKRQIFLNGNKRMSTLSLLVFLGINGKRLTVAPDELTEKSLWLAKTSSLDFPSIKSELVVWIQHHLENQPREQHS
ncbi:MAG: type II toxin-antitoxin system death-on-curing family toxin [Rhizomicrobium sp.]|nr:type II toxin-antitoxin system death-on-curing family toxin [Rhizomicrobium sp.]